MKVVRSAVVHSIDRIFPKKITIVTEGPIDPQPPSESIALVLGTSSDRDDLDGRNPT
jgi:hypothetical protein